MIPKKTIQKMTPKEVSMMTDDEVMQKIFGKKAAKVLRETVEKTEAKRRKKKSNDST